MGSEQKNSNESKVLLGTFSGVFVPSFLTIMGVIIFLRMGYVMGNAGLIEGLGIVLLANILSVLTSLSVSAVATNIKVKGGGVYYLISRSLGIEFGGPIGLVLFLSQAVSVAFYIIGFAEILVTIIPIIEPIIIYVEVLICVLLYLLARAGLDWAAKVQVWILGVLGLGLLSFLFGSLTLFDGEILKSNLYSNYLPGHSFWVIFAIFFPAITGFTQGVSLSGDLKDPQKSIPTGTLLAVGASLLIYIGFGVLVLGSSTRSNLLNDYLVMKKVSVLSFLIDLGVISATLSSALTSFLGAPRILQALARDKVFPIIRTLAIGYGPSRIPRRATMLTLIVALVCIVNGNLNAIAPVVTMFFLLTYGLMNYATFVEGFSNNPSFRPRFRFFHWRLSLAGAIGCLLGMLFIHALAAVIALLVIIAIHVYVKRSVDKSSWGDARRGFYFSHVRENLLRLRDERYHVKNWRPQMLVLCGRPQSRHSLVKVGTWLESGKGILTLANIIPGRLEEKIPLRNHEIESFGEYARKENLQVFWEVLVSPSYLIGVQSLVQCHSIGRVKPNTVLLGWADQKKNQERLIDVIQTVERLGKNIIIVDDEEGLFHDEHKGFELKDFLIDVWWRGEQNGSLMLLLAYMWTQNPECREGKIRLCRMVKNEVEKEQSQISLNELIHSARIEAEIKIIVSEESWVDAIPRVSGKSDVVFVGLAVPHEWAEEDFLRTYDPLVKKLPTTILVKSMETVDVRV